MIIKTSKNNVKKTVMNRKRFTLLLVVVILCPLFVLSQGKRMHSEEDRERMKSEKIAYITDKLDLSVKEAQAFWPLYNEFNNKNDKLFEEERRIKRNVCHNNENLSESELSDMVDRLIEIKIERANLEKEYHNKYKTVLSAGKLILLYEAEFGFRRHLLRKYRNHQRFDE